MGDLLNVLVFPRQRLGRVRAEVDDLSDSVMKLYAMDLSGICWAECREGVVARLRGSASPEMLVRIPSARLECTALMVCLPEGGSWGFRLCWKGTVEDFSPSGPEGVPPAPVTPEQHVARLARRFPKADREALLACLAREGDPDALEDFLGILAPWAGELLASGRLTPVPAPPPTDYSSPDRNSAGGIQPAPAPEPAGCLPFLTGVRAVRRGWAFPLSLLYRLFPQRRPRPEDIPFQGWTVRELAEVLDRFCSGELDRLELNFTLQGEGTYVRRLKKAVCQTFPFTLELIREGKRCMCLALDGGERTFYKLVAHRDPYMNVDIKDLKKTVFCGQTVEEYAVFSTPDLQPLRREVNLLLARLDRRDDALSATRRMGVWSCEGLHFSREQYQQFLDAWLLK